MSTIVLHNLPTGCIESDIHRALLMYGMAVHIAMDPRLPQAVVTMRTQQEAQALLNRRTVNVSGTSVRVDTQQAQAPPPPQQPPQPPTPQQPRPSYPSSAGGAYAYADAQPSSYPAAAAAPPSHEPLPSSYAPNTNAIFRPPMPASHAAGGAIMPAPPQTSRRLKVVVEDCRYPITREVLHRMFSMIAPPVMVSCGPYGPTTTGMVEFAEAASAQQAVDQFHNKAIYPDCCYVRLLFEPMWEVPMVSGSGAAVAAAVSAPATSATPPAVGYPYRAPGTVSPYAAPAPAAVPEAPARYPGWEGRPGEQDPYYYHDGPPQPPSAVGRGHGYYDYYGPQEGQPEYGRGGAPGLMGRGGRGGLRGRGAGVAGADFHPYPEPSAQRGGAAVAVGGRGAVAPLPSDNVVLVSNVDVAVPLYDLWVLLEVYGNVKSLNRQHSDRTHVVAHFQHAAETAVAVQYLHGCPFRGHRLRLRRFLGFQERTKVDWDLGPSSDPAIVAVTFGSDYHHRVAPHVVRNPRSAMYPDKNLFVNNLNEDTSDDEVDAMFRKMGFTPTASYRRGPRASIMGFADVETAVDALIATHLRDWKGQKLYVTFSRFPPEPRETRAEGEGEGVEENGEHHSSERESAVEEKERRMAARALLPPPAEEEAVAPAEKAEEAMTKEAKATAKTSKSKSKSSKK